MVEKLNLNDLKSKLYTEVSDYMDLKESYNDIKFKLDVLKEILQFFKLNYIQMSEQINSFGLQLSLIYDEKESDRIIEVVFDYIKNMEANNIDCRNSLKKLIENITNNSLEEYQHLANQYIKMKKTIDELKPQIIEYRRILSQFKYDEKIKPYQIDLITNLMDKYEFDKSNQIRILENIRIRNDRLANRKISYTVIKMLDEEYTKYEISNLESHNFKNGMKSIISSYYLSIMKSENVSELYELFPDLKSGQYTYEEFNYIFKSILNKIMDSLNDSIESIQDKEVYNDIDLRKVVIAEYNEMLQKYNKIRYFYNQECLMYENKQKNTEIEEELKEPENNLFYAFPLNGRESYIEKDLKDIPKEYLTRVKELLDKLKYNTLNYRESAGFNSNKQLKELRELRSDQIRIIYKQISSNNYLIIGVGVKKSDNDLKMYFTIASRNQTIDLTNEKAILENIEIKNQVEEHLSEYIKTNARKGSR